MAFSIDLSGKVVLVTGVSSGIGAGVANAFAAAGADVAGCSRAGADSEAAVRFVKGVEQGGRKALFVTTDVTLPEDLASLVEKTITRFGRLDIVISNAGVNIFEGAEKCSLERWEYNTKLNLTSHWQLAQFCKPWLEKNQGVILMMTSNHAFYTLPGCFPYNVTKTALMGLVQSIAVEWGPHIRCVGLAPGFIDTEGCQTWFDAFDDPVAARQKVIDLHPVKRIGTVEDVGAWCIFLTSALASFASGTTYLVDGGRSAIMQDS